MIEFIEGNLYSKSPAASVLQLGGIAYRIVHPLMTFEQLPLDGETVRFYIHFYVREDQQVYYGFLRREERDLFQLLLTVSGVGPKLAIQMMGQKSAEELCQQIASEDDVSLAKIKGLGKKTASKIVLDLPTKIASIGFLDTGVATNEKPDNKTNGQLQRQSCAEALEQLGFKNREYDSILDEVQQEYKDAALQEWIRQSLIRLNKL